MTTFGLFIVGTGEGFKKYMSLRKSYPRGGGEMFSRVSGVDQVGLLNTYLGLFA